MTILPLTDPAAFGLAVAEIHRAPILVQFPSVFVLLAAPTTSGAGQLDALKVRLPGKNYGTAIGSLAKFLAQADPARLPAEFTRARHYVPLTGTFLRLPFRDESVQSKTIRNGTHQGLLLGGLYGRLFRNIEESFAPYPPDALWGGQNYGAPLCTSCNLSGHPDGSIVAYDKALAFARERQVGLFLTATRPAKEKGSYPIFGFAPDSVRIYRDGPGLDTFKQKIPARLRAW